MLRDRGVGKLGCCNSRKLTQLFEPVVPYTSEQSSYTDCPHNIAIAAAERTYCETPEITAYGADLLERAYRLFIRTCRSHGMYPGSVDVWDSEKVISTRSGAKKHTYKTAFDALAEHPIVKEDFRVSAFVKFEQSPESTIGEKVPRLIQFRGPRALAKLSTYFAPLEHALYTMQFNGSPLYAKYHNAGGRGNIIARMLHPGRMLLGLDHSRFESHIRGKLMDLEHRFYKWVYHQDADLNRMLAWMRDNHVSARSSYSWKCRDTRMSGDYNTSLGNNIVNTIVMMAFAIHHGCERDIQIYLDGDDSVVSISDKTYHDMDLSVFPKIGMTTKLEDRAYIPEQVQFCQARPVRTDTGWVMMRDFRRTLSRRSSTIRQYASDAWAAYARGVVLGEMASSRGVPVLEAYAVKLKSELGEGRVIEEPEYDNKCRSDESFGVSDTTRVSYALAWGIAPSDQISIEEHIRTTDLTQPLRRLCRGE